MTKKELWLMLFQENDTALASAIHLCERFVNMEQLQNGAEFIEQKKRELYSEIPAEQIVAVFGNTANKQN